MDHKQDDGWAPKTARRRDGSIVLAHVVDSEGRTIAQLTMYDDEPVVERCHLIASAPALYEALASLMTAVDYTRVLPGPKGAELKKRALAALNLARGDQ